MFQTFENFEPRKVGDRDKKVEGQRKALEEMVETRYNFTHLEILELLPAQIRQNVAVSLYDSFLESIEKKDVTLEFDEEELEMLDRFDVAEDHYVYIGNLGVFYKIQTQSDGVRYLLGLKNEIMIFKADTDLKKLSDAMAFIQ